MTIDLLTSNNLASPNALDILLQKLNVGKVYGGVWHNHAQLETLFDTSADDVEARAGRWFDGNLDMQN